MSIIFLYNMLCGFNILCVKLHMLCIFSKAISLRQTRPPYFCIQNNMATTIPKRSIRLASKPSNINTVKMTIFNTVILSYNLTRPLNKVLGFIASFEFFSGRGFWCKRSCRYHFFHLTYTISSAFSVQKYIYSIFSREILDVGTPSWTSIRLFDNLTVCNATSLLQF